MSTATTVGRANAVTQRRRPPNTARARSVSLAIQVTMVASMKAVDQTVLHEPRLKR